MAFANTRANIGPRGISSIKIKRQGDDAYYNWPYFREGKVLVTPVSKPDRRGRPMTTNMVMWKCEFTTMSADTVVCQLYDAIISNSIHVKVACFDGTTYSSQLVSATVGHVGVEFEHIIGGDAEDDVNTHWTLSRVYTHTNFAAAMGSPPADGTPNVTDTLYAMAAEPTIGDIVSAAIVQIEIREASVSGSWTHTINNIRNARLTLSSLTNMDSLKRPLGYGINIDFSAEFMQASASEIPTDFNTINSQENDMKLTLAGGQILSFDGLLAVRLGVDNQGDLDSNSFIAITAQGKCLLSEWNAIFTSLS